MCLSLKKAVNIPKLEGWKVFSQSGDKLFPAFDIKHTYRAPYSEGKKINCMPEGNYFYAFETKEEAASVANKICADWNLHHKPVIRPVTLFDVHYEGSLAHDPNKAYMAKSLIVHPYAPSFKEEKGDLVKMAKEGRFDVIIHGCNCYKTMGAGIAKQIKEEFPQAYEADLKAQPRLGGYSSVKVGDLIVVNAYTQMQPGPYFRPWALDEVLKDVLKVSSGARFGIPLIGCGIGGGEWETVRCLIDSIFDGEDLTVVHYEQCNI